MDKVSLALLVASACSNALGSTIMGSRPEPLIVRLPALERLDCPFCPSCKTVVPKYQTLFANIALNSSADIRSLWEVIQ